MIMIIITIIINMIYNFWFYMVQSQMVNETKIWRTEFRLLNHHVIIFFHIYSSLFKLSFSIMQSNIIYSQPLGWMEIFFQWKFNTIMMKPWNWFKAKYNKEDCHTTNNGINVNNHDNKWINMVNFCPSKWKKEIFNQYLIEHYK